MSFDSAKRIMSGTWGEVWMNGEYVAECFKTQVKDTYTRESVAMAGKLRAGKKLASMEGTGSLGLRKVNSRMAILVGEEIKAGRDPEFTLIVKLDDPDAYGAERVAVTGVKFDDLTLIDFEVGVITNTEHPFTYDDYELLDRVEVEQ